MSDTPKPADLDFSKMFDDLAKIDHKNDQNLTPIPEPEPVVLNADEPPAPVEEPPAPAPADEPPAPVDEPPAPAPTPEPRLSTDDILSQFANIVAERAQPTPAPAAPAPAAEPPPLYSADEQAMLSSYEKDWPDVAKAEAIRRRGEYQQLLGYVFNEVAQRLAPLENLVRGTTERSHVQDLYTLIPDYDTVRDPVIGWVQGQPDGIMKQTYLNIVQQGTPNDVAMLVNQWKSANGVQAAPAAAPAPAKPAVAPEVRQAV